MNGEPSFLVHAVNAKLFRGSYICTRKIDLLNLICLSLQHNAEPEAVDLLMEVKMECYLINSVFLLV